MDDDLPKFSYGNRNNLRFSRLTTNLDEPRVPPLPDAMLYESDKPKSGKQTVHNAKNKRHIAQGSRKVLNCSERSNNENSNVNQSVICKAMKLKKRKKRMSVEMIRNKSNDILGELFAVNRSSDSDCVCLGQDSPGKKHGLLDRKSSVESDLSEDSDFHTGRCSSHKKTKHTDNREVVRKDEFDHRKRKHKTKQSKPIIWDEIVSNTPEKVHRDSVKCKKRLKYNVKATKVKHFSDSDVLTKVKESNTPVKVGRDSEECKKRLKYRDDLIKGKQVFDSDTVSKVKDGKQKVIGPKTLKEKSTVSVKQKPTNNHGIFDLLRTLKFSKQTEEELKRNTLKQCYVLLSDSLKHGNEIAECNTKQKSPFKNDSEDSKTVKSQFTGEMQIVPNVKPPLHDVPESNTLTKSCLNEFHNPLQKHNIELHKLDPPAQKDIEGVEIDDKPFIKNFETQSAELNSTLQKDEELISDVLVDDNILFETGIPLKNTERHFLDIFPSENDIASESNTEDDPTWTGDSSLNYTLRSSEYSDISDTDDDELKDPTPVSNTLPMFFKYRQVFSNIYSDISEESDNEMTVKGFSRCSSPLIDHRKDEIANFKRDNDVDESEEGEKQTSLKQMEEFMANISSSEGFSDDDDDDDVHFDGDISGQFFNQNCRKYEVLYSTDKDMNSLTYSNENSLIRDAFVTLQAEAVDTINIVPMEEELLSYLDGFPKLENPYQSSENDNSLQHPIIYIDVDEESDFDSSFNFEQHENLQDEVKKFDTASRMKEYVPKYGDSSKLNRKDFSVNLLLENGTEIVSDNKKNSACGSALKEKNCSSIATDFTETSLGYHNNEAVLWHDKSETISNLYSDKNEELPDIPSKDLKTVSYVQKYDNSDSPNSTMPNLSAISSTSEDHSSPNSTISCNKSASLQLIASAYASPVMTVLTPVMPVLTPVIMFTSSKPRRRKVRCKIAMKSASKRINFDFANDYVSSHVIKKFSVCAKDLNQSHFQLKGYVLSDTTKHKPRLPQSKESLLDLCLDDALMIGDTFFELLLHLQDQFEIPCYTLEFLIQSLWLNAGTCLRQIHSARNILKKIAVCDSSTVALSWHQINVSIEHMFSDLTAISSKEILQVEYYLELVMDVLKNDIYRRNLSDISEIRQSRAYQLFSQDSNCNIPRNVINYIHHAMNMIENGTTTATFRSKLMKLLHWLQDLLVLTIDISSCCKDRAVALAIELKYIYTNLPNLASKKLLLHSIESELLLFCLVELILECEFDDTQPLCDFSLDAVMSSFCQAVPQVCMRSPKITPEKTTSSAFSTNSRYAAEQVEELAMLQYLVTKSYLQVAKEKFDKPLHWRSGDNSLGFYDVEILQKEWVGYMNDVQKHMHSLSSDLSLRTTQYLMMMECLADCI